MTNLSRSNLFTLAKLLIGLLIFILIALLNKQRLIAGTKAKDSPGDYYECSSCSDCENKINSAHRGQVVKLTEDITYNGDFGRTCINWQNTEVTFDCQNYIVDGNFVGQDLVGGSEGIKMFNQSNNIIMNCKLRRFKEKGIFFYNSSYNKVKGNEITNIALDGFHLWSSHHNEINNNIVSENGFEGVAIAGSNFNEFNENTISNNGVGIYLKFSSSNVLRSNTMVDNSNGNLAFDQENESSHYDNSIDASNTVNGKPVMYYYENCDEVISDKNLTHLTIAKCEDLVLRNNKIEGGDGITLAFVDNSEIYSNEILDSVFGISTRFSYSNVIRNNLVRSSSGSGIHLFSSPAGGSDFGNTLSNNEVEDAYHGIYLVYSNSNVIDDNIISSCSNAIFMSNSSSGNVINNSISNSQYGIFLSGSSANIMENNTISNGYIGVYLLDSPSNIITSNEILNHTGEAPLEGVGIRIQRNGSSATTINANNISRNTTGILIGDSSSHKIDNNFILNNEVGVYLFRDTLNNELNGNTLCYNTGYDIQCSLSSSGFGSNTFDTKEGCSDISQTAPCDDSCLQADLDESGIIDSPDAVILLNAYLLSEPGDLNFDSRVNSLDFGGIVSLWGQICTSPLSPSPSLNSSPS